MITSTSNTRIKDIRKLRDRKERQQAGVYYLEGLRIVGEAVQTGAPIEAVVYSPDLLKSEFGLHLVELQRARGVDLLEVSPEVFRSIALKEGPQGIAAVVRQKWFSLEEIELQASETWVGLDAVADPGNLGTIMRTHDAVGGAGLIILDQATDPFDPVAIRASMGAVFSQKLVKASFEQFATWKKSCNYPVVGTAGASSEDYVEISYPSKLVLLMGSERMGLQENHIRLCDRMVRIPMVGRSDSLNLAVATAVVLYEIFNQRRKLHVG